MSARKSIAVIGSGISGLSAAWLLSRAHDVTLYEQDGRLGGHSNTVDVPIGGDGQGRLPVDTGFIVFNEACYPNLIALFDRLDVPTSPTDMGFSVSIDAGRYEYSGNGIGGLFGQSSNLLRPGHWRMVADLLRFFREAPKADGALSGYDVSLGDYLATQRYSDEFIARHILPMAAAIWSTPSADVLEFPLSAFLRFFSNHGLLQVRNRPLWRTVRGGSREYVRRLTADMNAEIRAGEPVRAVTRSLEGVEIVTRQGSRSFDGVVLATHADDALRLLADADGEERQLLGSFRYARNRAVLHRDATFMPRRRRLWSSWNYLGIGEGLNRRLSVTYWMNKLQPLGEAPELFVTLNPACDFAAEHEIAAFDYAHPMFDARAMSAQRGLWRLQGRRRTWFCGSYFGYGFHEDGIQSGLAAAEAVGGVRRPWQVVDESGRIHLHPSPAPLAEAAE